jgi:long-subunit acyl-CoA synthetase (AMP-forming)
LPEAFAKHNYRHSLTLQVNSNLPAYCLPALAGKEARLKGFEFPKAVHLDAEPFSIEHDLITPKLSLKRPQLLKYYKAKVSML